MSAAFRHTPELMPLGKRSHENAVSIRVVGVGGAGGNAVARMIADGISGVEFIVANTDAQALQASPVARRLRLGEALTRGLGAGGDPAIGAQAAQESLEELRVLLRGADLVFVTAGMGGGTGTGAAPVVARLARELGALTVAVVSSPFRFEGTRRARLAERGIDELRPFVDTLIVVPNERLLAIVDNHQPFIEALRIGDAILQQGVRGISDLITIPGLINLDFADVRSVITGAGTALMTIGEASGERRATTATQRAVESPLLERDMHGARHILLNVTGGTDLTLMEINEAASIVQSLAHPEATIIFGTVQDETMHGMMRVTLIATGFAPEGQTYIREESAHATRPLLPQTSWHADVITPEILLGDAWPLPETTITEDEQPTVALPALPLSPAISAAAISVSPTSGNIVLPDAPVSVASLADEWGDDDTEIEDTSPRLQRAVEMTWTPPSKNHPDASGIDIPAFLRWK